LLPHPRREGAIASETHVVKHVGIPCRAVEENLPFRVDRPIEQPLGERFGFGTREETGVMMKLDEVVSSSCPSVDNTSWMFEA
jgi:hypothetical protein